MVGDYCRSWFDIWVCYFSSEGIPIKVSTDTNRIITSQLEHFISLLSATTTPDGFDINSTHVNQMLVSLQKSLDILPKIITKSLISYEKALEYIDIYFLCLHCFDLITLELKDDPFVEINYQRKIYVDCLKYWGLYKELGNTQVVSEMVDEDASKDQRDDPCPELLLDESSEEKRKVKNMESSRDFIQWLGQDMSMKILMCLDDPVDLVRATAVSSSWRQFVITNGICKQLCLRMFPESSSFTRDELKELQYLAIEHRAYASLSHSLSSSPKISCIADAIFASSTDNYPRESILNTLEQSDRVDHRASYWSSKGASNVATPESLVYKLSSQLCVVDEVHIHPFQAYLQYGFPIYSAKAVRFHMGKYKAQMEVESSKRDGIFDTQEFSDDRFSWTYTSPEFPMVQENCLQKFSLLEHVLCIGGILKVELLGRVQTHEMDRLYSFCINYVQVFSRPLSPVFDIKILGSLCAGVHWTPAVFAVAQRECVDSFLSQNSFICYENLQKLGILQPNQFLQSRYPKALNGVVTINPLPLGQPLCEKVEKQPAHFYSVTITQTETQAELVYKFCLKVDQNRVWDAGGKFLFSGVIHYHLSRLGKTGIHSRNNIRRSHSLEDKTVFEEEAL